MDHLIYQTGFISLIVQLITGIIGIVGIFIPLSPPDKILNNIISIEVVVQFIEFIFYLWLMFSIYAKNINITSFRYIDWFITTPIMLTTIIFFFAYQTNLDKFKDKEGNITMKEIIKKEYKTIIPILIFNFLMLLFGLLGELGILNKYISLILGTFFFLLSFYSLYKNYVVLSQKNNNIFYFIFIIWAIYGIVYLLPYNYRNASYNILDIFSKNVYGLFLFYKILQKRK
jgi:hypothetical protein